MIISANMLGVRFPQDHLEVELALQDVNKPIGVAEYQYLLPKSKLQELVTDEMKKSMETK